jgi:hypothetical protein
MATNSSSPLTDKPEKSVLSLDVACPHCQLRGLISLGRIEPNKRVRCQRCDKWFRIQSQGSVAKTEAPDAAITVAVRRGSSGWTEHLAPESGRSQRRSARPALLTRLQRVSRQTWIAAALTVGLLVGGLAYSSAASRHESAPAVAAEPEGLAGRAIAFGRAWACNDVDGMRRFIADRETKALITWLQTAQPETMFDDADPQEIQVEAASINPQGRSGLTVVILNLGLRPASAAPAADPICFPHQHTWKEIDGKWYFAPQETMQVQRAAPSPGRR